MSKEFLTHGQIKDKLKTDASGFSDAKVDSDNDYITLSKFKQYFDDQNDSSLIDYDDTSGGYFVIDDQVGIAYNIVFEFTKGHIGSIKVGDLFSANLENVSKYVFTLSQYKTSWSYTAYAARGYKIVSNNASGTINVANNVRRIITTRESESYTYIIRCTGVNLMYNIIDANGNMVSLTNRMISSGTSVTITLYEGESFYWTGLTVLSGGGTPCVYRDGVLYLLSCGTTGTYKVDTSRTLTFQATNVTL